MKGRGKKGSFHTGKTGHFTFVTVWCRRTDVRSRDYQNFSNAWITKFSYPWCSAAGGARKLRLKFVIKRFFYF